jgi:hypothetical protein
MSFDDRLLDAHGGSIYLEWQPTIGVVIAGLAPVAVLLTTHTLVRLVVAPPAEVAVAVVEPDVAPVVEAVPAEPEVEIEPKHDRIRRLRETGMAYSAIVSARSRTRKRPLVE